MERLQFDYQMRIAYSEPVSMCHFTLKCFPMQDARQQVLTCRTRLLPDCAFSEGTDSFGNRLIYGSIRQPHEAFDLRVTGEVAMMQSQYEAEQEEEPYLYRHPHGMNRPGEGIRAYYAALSAQLPCQGRERAEALMHRLYRDFSYEKGCTDANTPAEIAFGQGRGVCQDYAHIYIALCHLAGLPARYVTGILLGEGESHAWVEVLLEGKWVGLDVTNDIPVTASHIKFGHGRDAGDCRLNTGIVYGSAAQSQSAHAVVQMAEE